MCNFSGRDSTGRMKIGSVASCLEVLDGCRDDLERVLVLEQIWQKHNLKESDGKTD